MRKRSNENVTPWFVHDFHYCSLFCPFIVHYFYFLQAYTAAGLAESIDNSPCVEIARLQEELAIAEDKALSFERENGLLRRFVSFVQCVHVRVRVCVFVYWFVCLDKWTGTKFNERVHREDTHVMWNRSVATFRSCVCGLSS